MDQPPCDGVAALRGSGGIRAQPARQRRARGAHGELSGGLCPFYGKKKDGWESLGQCSDIVFAARTFSAYYRKFLTLWFKGYECLEGKQCGLILCIPFRILFWYGVLHLLSYSAAMLLNSYFLPS